MEFLIWIGAAISAIGLAGLVWCIVAILRAKRANLPEEEMRERLRRAVNVNLGAFMLSVLGLIVIVFGVLLS